ncbi:hypothetical protein, partial [Pseudomonas aeruginosa]|uniref:hypothetical protein n=1 Tax=Pseudomonas aeruginosa TaxID=287 RepID=UPI001EE6CA8F
PKPFDKTKLTATRSPMGTPSPACRTWSHRVGQKAGGSSIMIRSLDIPRGRLAVPWPLRRESQARVFDAGAEADSDVAQNEGRE